MGRKRPPTQVTPGVPPKIIGDLISKPFSPVGGRKRPSRPRIPGGCPDPNMHILMADGSHKKAGDLKVGDLIKTNHEETLKLGEYKVEYVNILENVEKIKFTFDKNIIICSSTHKFYVNDSWKEAKDMVIGDVVSDKNLTAIESVEDGDVVHITIEDAHTYICEGLLSHNKRFAPNDPRRGGRGGRGDARKRTPGFPKPRSLPPGALAGYPGQGGGPRVTPRVTPRGRRRMPPKDRPLTGGYDPISGVRYTDTGVPTAVQDTERVPVQDPTLGGLPEREVPMPKERRERITRESDPRGSAPFSPDERGMARDRFFERMFDRADERRQQKDMEREDMRETRRAMRDERRARRSDPGEIDIDAERGGRRRRRGRRRDFTRRRSRMEGGRRGRSREERAAFRDRYVSTLR